MKKTCGTCLSEKDITAFSRKGEGFCSKCKECQKLYHKEWWSRNEERNAKARRKSIREYKKSLAALISSLKDKPCCDCGGRFKPWQMDFDHLGKIPKYMNVSRLATSGVGRRRILEEISKCDLVCANCHRDRTHRRQVKKAGA